MKLRIFKALWGMTGPVQEQLKQVKEAGYDGIEVWTAAFSLSSTEWIRLVEEYQLELIVAAAIEDADSLQRQLTELAAFQPLKINVQGGRDSMTWAEGCRFLEEALRVEATLGVPVLHESHRGKLFFNPWTTAAYLREFEGIKITADYSHWVNVCERLPDDQATALSLANQRAQHIHGRVGYAEGPQVPDPAAPEYATELAWHEQQWDQIHQQRSAAGAETFTFTPEYGPPGYLHTLPYTNVPVADLWTVCLWAANRARQRWSETSTSHQEA